ncbi:peptide deformylase [Candidatus Magnetaquicoccus inordinatus]|uniref:peptide deformylase n=1 Tax=Candidatus Magnetaquicoccus inordinatus TaxID=2496818 RepID=UPI00102BC4A1|nr:peptide deformylase [Candidatus Magnetaquicoccus inordinatus]
MAILEILTYPDVRLRAYAEEINDFSALALQQLIDDLLETMAALPACVGVAAPQTGHALRLLVMDCGNGRKPPAQHHGQLVVINPEILQWSETDIGREGCLSLPDYTGNVLRAQTIRVRFQDRNGVEQTLDLSGFEARVMQHEIDHLDGRLFTDRIVSRKTDLFLRKNRL